MEVNFVDGAAPVMKIFNDDGKLEQELPLDDFAREDINGILEFEDFKMKKREHDPKFSEKAQ